MKKISFDSIPQLLFVTADTQGTTFSVYLKDGKDYVALNIKANKSYSWRSSGFTAEIEAERSKDFDFKIDPCNLFYLSPKSKLQDVSVNSVEYERSNVPSSISEWCTNVFTISDRSFGFAKDLKFATQSEIIEKLTDEVVKERLMKDKTFSEIVLYQKSIFEGV